MHTLAAAGPDVSGGLWAYLVLFVLAAIGWAGVPAIGGAVIAGSLSWPARVSLNIVAVLAAFGIALPVIRQPAPQQPS